MAIATQLADIVGADHVMAWDAVDPQLQQTVQAAIAGPTAPTLVYPATVEELRQVVSLAHRQSLILLPMGQGSKLSWGGLGNPIDIVVSTARLNRVIEHAVGDFTVTVEAGLKVSELQAMLAKERQFLAVDPAFETDATVGGIVSTADTGALRQRYGGVRDMLIGVQFVRYDGQVARGGGRVVKNVAGYDLMKLMTGTYGSLGILSELTFRLYPAQTNQRSLILLGKSEAIAQATAAARRSGLTPMALDILSAKLLPSLLPDSDLGSDATTIGLVARFQGVAEGVDEQTERLLTIARTCQLHYQQLDNAADLAFWQRCTQVIKPETVLCKVGIKPSEVTSFVSLVDSLKLDVNGSATVEIETRLHASSGLGYVQMDRTQMTDEPAIDTWVKAIEKMRSHCQNHGGFLSILQAPKALKAALDVWGYTGNALSVMADIKAKFDPSAMLSPNRFVGNL